jgi:hypothetical protein
LTKVTGIKKSASLPTLVSYHTREMRGLEKPFQSD